MHTFCKEKGGLIVGTILVTAFVSLHYFVYLNNSPSTLPVIQSTVDSPVDISGLVLCDTKKPSYINPFQKVTFAYQTEQDGTYSECTITEKAISMFGSEVKAQDGGPYDYWTSYEEDGFGRPQVGFAYANMLFFLVQYALVVGYIILLVKNKKPETLQ